MKKTTVFFEERFGVDISEFRSTKDIDEFIERKLGRPLRIIYISEYLHRKTDHQHKAMTYAAGSISVFVLAWYVMILSLINNFHPIGVLVFVLVPLADELMIKANDTYRENIYNS
jgi:hypothetical protein